MPFFTVIIPTYNRLEMVLQALESVWSQTFSDYEVIVVDDGSTDGTSEKLQALRSRARVLRQPNRGQGAARNKGIHSAAGEYVVFLDSDDLWFPWTLAAFHNVIGQYEYPAFISGTEIVFESAHLLAENEALKKLDTRFFADYLTFGKESAWVPPSATAIKKDALLAVGGFPEKRMSYEESDLWLRLGIAKGFVRVTDPPFCARRLHPGNITHQVKNSMVGIQHMIQTERAGAYPGGKERELDRIRIITRHIIPFSRGCVQNNRLGDGLSLYFESLFWNIRVGRHYKYTLGFPVFSAYSFCLSLIRSVDSKP
jgi:glycosyltransferase involved in cell wall biosynthesis